MVYGQPNGYYKVMSNIPKMGQANQPLGMIIPVIPVVFDRNGQRGAIEHCDQGREADVRSLPNILQAGPGFQGLQEETTRLANNSHILWYIDS